MKMFRAPLSETLGRSVAQAARGELGPSFALSVRALFPDHAVYHQRDKLEIKLISL
jgi:hypothetical protein